MLRLIHIFTFTVFCSGFLFACSHSPKQIENENLPHNSNKQTTTEKGYKIAQLAKSLRGSPYRYGGNTPKQGFDCSGLVYYTHGKFGVHVPRTSKQQFNSAKPISIKELQSGDLVFFKLNKRDVSHVGIYIGRGQFIHAPKSGKRVSSSNIHEPYWQARIAGSGRLY